MRMQITNDPREARAYRTKPDAIAVSDHAAREFGTAEFRVTQLPRIGWVVEFERDGFTLGWLA